jgi:CheY-like chemotaxis protein
MPKLLLIEDNEHIQRVYSDKLRREGFDVATAADGETGLATAQAARPDAVLLDIMLPKLNGFDVLKHFQQDPALRQVPVFMLSNRAWPADVQEALALGARQFYSKGSAPFHDIVRQIRTECGLKKIVVIAAGLAAAQPIAQLLAHPRLLCALQTIPAEACTATERGAPDLIVLDGRQGTAAATLQQLKNSSTLRAVPLFVITDTPLAFHRADACIAPDGVASHLRAAVLQRLGLA